MKSDPTQPVDYFNQASATNHFPRLPLVSLLLTIYGSALPVLVFGRFDSYVISTPHGSLVRIVVIVYFLSAFVAILIGRWLGSLACRISKPEHRFTSRIAYWTNTGLLILWFAAAAYRFLW